MDDEVVPGYFDLIGAGIHPPGLDIQPMGSTMGGGMRVPPVEPRAKLADKMSKGGTWKHPINKGQIMRRPFEEMFAGYEDMPGSPLDKLNMTPEDVQGSLLVPFVGDRTRAGKNLVSINGEPLDSSVPLEGGGNFMFLPGSRHDNAIWASDESRIQAQQERYSKILQDPKYKGEKLIGSTVAMGPLGGDFAKMTTDPLIQQLKKGIQDGTLTPEALKFLDDEATANMTNWPGAKNAVNSDWLNTTAGGNRAELAKILMKAKYQDLGFPDVASIRKAITEPALMDAPGLASGFSLGEIDPLNYVIRNPANQHQTYNTSGRGKALGGFENLVPPDIFWRDFMREKANTPTKSGKPISGGQLQRGLEMGNVVQKADQEWVDANMAYQERMRQGR